MKKLIALFALLTLFLSHQAHTQNYVGSQPTPTNPVASSVGGTGSGSVNALSSLVAAKANAVGPIYPPVYVNAPTITYASTTTGITTPQKIGLNGQSITSLMTANALSGQAVITVSTTDAAKIQVGMQVNLYAFPSGGPANNTQIVAAPAGTTVSAVNTSTGAVTLSANLTHAVSNGYPVYLGPQVIKFLGQNIVFGNLSPGVWLLNRSSGNIYEAQWVFETDHYGSEIDFPWRAESTTAGVWVWVDGQPVTADMQSQTGLSGGSTYYTRVVFDNASDNVVRPRRVRVYLNTADPFQAAAYIGPTDTVSLPKTPYPIIAFYGDSYIEGAGSTSSMAQNIPFKTAYLLGGGGPGICAQGGTGILNNYAGLNNKSYFTDVTRVATCAALNPDILISMGSVNDGTYVVTQAIAQAFYQQLITAMPRTRIFIVGVQSIGNSGDAYQNRLANDRNQMTAAAALGLPYLSPIQNKWVWGSGNSGSLAGLGNADVLIYSDGTHPTTVGADFYARKIASFVSNKF